MKDAIEPLCPSLWFERIEKIASDGLGSVENALRHAGHLLQLTPTIFRDVVRLGVGEEQFEALLDAGSLDVAARYLVGQPTALAVEANTDDKPNFRATIGCAILGRAISGTGDSEALAILDAWTTCLLSLRSEFFADEVNDPGPSAHKYRSG